MDPLTHALSGALVARALPVARSPALTPREVFVAGAASAVFPDLDFVLRLVDTLTYLNHHAGITHSLLLWPAWSLLLAHGFAWLIRRHEAWRAFLPITAAGIGIHIAGDIITAYGVHLLAPFSARRYAGDIQFVVDGGLFLILLAGVVLSLRWPRRHALPAAALALAALYVSGSALLKQQALEIADTYAGSLKGTTLDRYVLPQPPSPFHWLLVVRTPDSVYSARVNLVAARSKPRSADASWWQRYESAFRPQGDLDWQRSPRADSPHAPSPAPEAWGTPALKPLRHFMRFPVLDMIEAGCDLTCVRFVDLRFTLPEVTPSFRYGACQASTDSAWTLTRWRGDFYIN